MTTKTPVKKPRTVRPTPTTATAARPTTEPPSAATSLLRAALATSHEASTATVTRLVRRARDYATTAPELTEAQLLVAAQTVLEVGRLGHVANAQIASAMLAGWLERRRSLPSEAGAA